jgi:hypothetical protein
MYQKKNILLTWKLENGSRIGFEVLTAVSTKMAVFWVVAPTFEMLVYSYQSTRRYSPEDSHLGFRPYYSNDPANRDHSVLRPPIISV